MTEGEAPSEEELTGLGTPTVPESGKGTENKKPSDGAEENVAGQDEINLELSRLTQEYGVQKSELLVLLGSGVALDDLDALIYLKVHTTTVDRGFSIDPADFKEVEITYDQLLRLYKMCKQAEGDNWDDLAGRIIEHALASEDGDPEGLENQGHWAALNESMKKYKKMGERMFGDDF